jgi:hypothetical protein
MRNSNIGTLLKGSMTKKAAGFCVTLNRPYLRDFSYKNL